MNVHHAPKMVNLPRALFDTRTGREPRYHLSIEDAPEWAYRGEPLASLKGYPGVLQERPRRKKARRGSDVLIKVLPRFPVSSP